MYAASYGHVIVKELIGRSKYTGENKKGQFWSISYEQSADDFEWRDELAHFVEQTEDELTSQNFCRWHPRIFLVVNLGISQDPNHDIAMQL